MAITNRASRLTSNEKDIATLSTAKKKREAQSSYDQNKKLQNSSSSRRFQGKGNLSRSPPRHSSDYKNN